MDYSWWPALLEGLLVTLKVLGISAISSLFVGVFVGFVVSSEIRAVRLVCQGYISIFRDTPLLVQLFFLFYGLPFLGITISPFMCGIIGITLNEGAFMAEILRGSIQGISKEDWEAAKALGMSWFQVMRYVIVPQALKDTIPTLTGQVSIVLKDTTLLLLIMIPELTFVARRIYTKTFDSRGFLIVAALFITVFWLITLFSAHLEKSLRVRR